MRLQVLRAGWWWIWLCWCWSATSATSCNGQGVCKCVFDNGDVLDMTGQHEAEQQIVYDTSAYNTNSAGNKWIMETYYFHPCKNMPLGDQNLTPNYCKSASVCKHSVEFVKTNGTIVMTDSGNDLLGLFEGSTIQGEDGKVHFAYSYKTVTTIIYLECIESNNPKLVLEVNDANKPVLRFYSKYACLHTECHHSLGTTLLIIFLVITILYIVSGICVKYFLMGARGVEVIPNYNFWKDLPDLVREGIAFIQNGCKPPFQQHSASTPGSNPTANSYDSI